MSDEAPKIDPKYYEPKGGSRPKLAPAPQRAFTALLWAGLILAAVGVVCAVGVTVGAGVELLGYAVPLFVGAGVVAGLGKRTGE